MVFQIMLKCNVMVHTIQEDGILCKAHLHNVVYIYIFPRSIDLQQNTKEGIELYAFLDHQ